MPHKRFSADEFRAVARSKRKPDSDGVVVRFSAEQPEIIADTRTIRFVFSDDSVDRAGDRIEAGGWDTEDFLKNPVALWAHMSWEPPIGRAKNVHVTGNKLVGDIEFASADISPRADEIYQLVKGGYINAVSVGFIPREWSFTKDKNRPYGIDFKKQELMEISVCPVPCNANALAEARAKGLISNDLDAWWAKHLPDLTSRAPADAGKSEGAASDDPPVEGITTNTDKAAGEGTDAGGGAVVPPGNCARGKDETCGMKDPQECSVHYTPAEKSITTKSGRRISKDNIEKLSKAVEHIKSVIDSNDPDNDGDNDMPGAGGDTDNDGGAAGVPGDNLPLQTMSEEDRLRASARETLAAIGHH